MTSQRDEIVRSSVDGLSILTNVTLSTLTTLGVGGPAKFFLEARTEDEITKAIDHATANGQKILVLGGGSNLLVSDAGFSGLVVKVGIRGVRRLSENVVEAGAGENWDDFVEYCVNEKLAGIECLSGIPGFVGGTPIQNVGAYGQDVSESIVSVRCFDRQNNSFTDLSNSDCGFSYRSSIFNSTSKDRYIVTAVTFSLNHNGSPKVAYRDLKEKFGEQVPSLGQVRDAVIAIRSEKSMVIVADDPNRKSAGSFFKNPIIGQEHFEALKSQFPHIPQFPADNGLKVPAAWLIENAGFAKGYRSGEAGISSRHSLALINAGNATAKDILRLRDAIKAAVKNIFDIELKQEPVMAGFER